MLIPIVLAGSLGIVICTTIEERTRRRRNREAQQSHAYRLIASVLKGVQEEP